MGKKAMKILGCRCNNTMLQLGLLLLVSVAGLYLLNKMEFNNLEGYGTINTPVSTPLDLPFDSDPGVVTGTNNKMLILVHAEWCGHCKKFMPTWKEFINKYKSNPVMGVGTINDASLKGEYEKIKTKYEINGYPTLLVVDTTTGEKLSVYEGERTISALEEFANSQ